MRTEIVHNMSMDEYRGKAAVSASDLKNLKRSPAYAHMRKSVSTSAMEWGTAVHTAVLEPEKLLDRYKPEPKQPEDNEAKVWRATKLFKESAAKLLLDPEVEALLSAQQFEDLAQIQRNVQKDDIGADLHSLTGFREASIFTHLDEFDTWVKIRPDWLIPEARMIVDIKTDRDPRPAGFSRACGQYDYHMSAAMYLDAIEPHGTYEHYVFLVIASDAPFEVRSYTLDSDSIEQGRFEYRRGLSEWRQHREEGFWPGGTGKIEELRIPEYRINYHMEDAA